jgi:hypothetical protein
MDWVTDAVAVHSCMYVMECWVAAGYRELFWDVTQHRLVVSYRRFDITYWFHLQVSSVTGRIFLDYLTLEDGTDMMSRNVGN